MYLEDFINDAMMRGVNHHEDFEDGYSSAASKFINVTKRYNECEIDEVIEQETARVALLGQIPKRFKNHTDKYQDGVWSFYADLRKWYLENKFDVFEEYDSQCGIT